MILTIAAIIAASFVALCVHRAGLGNSLRKVEFWVLAMADAADYAKRRNRELNNEFAQSGFMEGR